ncbi:MAG TPA: bifunctional metallophosphatase/5'-nucleotidase [Allosphingosinicella sp.]|jgi:5'-nucleotidase
MRLKLVTMVAAVALGGCTARTGQQPVGPNNATAPLEVKIIAFNDFHGNLMPPKRSIDLPLAGGGTAPVPAGGAAYFASAVAQLKADNPNHVVVSAGDMIGASPLVSSLFLDEPTILAMNMIGVDFNAVGNHEFDRGSGELLRMRHGGCEKFTARQPCRVDPGFGGAKFDFLAANTVRDSGGTLFPAYGIKTFGKGRNRVKVAFIGMTLEATPSVVTPAGVAGLSFRDEADTANALIPKLKAGGADAIVIVIHEGAVSKKSYNDKDCSGLSGDLLPILDRLDPEVDVVVSGHTHNAYVCDYAQINPAKPFLVTSAGQYGTMLTDIRLTIGGGEVRAKLADNVIVQGEGYSGSRGEVVPVASVPRFEPNPAVAQLVSRYQQAAAPVEAEPVGKLSGAALRERSEAGESVLGNLIADAQLAATATPAGGGAQIAFMNTGGIRADLVPGAGGVVTFGQAYAVQPFGNSMTVKTMTGSQLKALLEQQFNSGANSVESPNILQVSNGFSYAYDLSKPAGERIREMTLNGAPVRDDATYRVAMSNFLSSGGDNFTVFRDGTDPVGGLQDIEVLAAYLSGAETRPLPALGRIRNLTPKP